MGLVVIGVQCVSANSGRCYARELVSAAEEFDVPITWFVGVSSRDPMGNANLYRNEYLHRIPSWHEIGLLLDLGNGVASSGKARADLIRLGKEVLKQCHVKPTACWVTGAELDGGVIRALEDVGMLVAIAPELTDGGAPLGLFHPDYDSPSRAGSAKLFRMNATQLDLAAMPEGGKALSGGALSDACTLVWTRDDRDDSPALRRVLNDAREAGIPVRVATAAIRG